MANNRYSGGKGEYIIESAASTSFAGSDAIVSFAFPNERAVTAGYVSALSYSVLRPKFEVQTLGRISTKAFTKGPRIVAGTIVFTVLGEHPMMWLKESINYLRGYRMLKMDELPLFDIIITYANEYGDSMKMVIYGCTLEDESMELSTQNLYNEIVLRYRAKDIEYLRGPFDPDAWAIQAGLISSTAFNRDIGEFDFGANFTVSNLLGQKEYEKYRDLLNALYNQKVQSYAGTSVPSGGPIPIPWKSEGTWDSSPSVSSSDSGYTAVKITPDATKIEIKVERTWNNLFLGNNFGSFKVQEFAYNDVSFQTPKLEKSKSNVTKKEANDGFIIAFDEQPNKALYLVTWTQPDGKIVKASKMVEPGQVATITFEWSGKYNVEETNKNNLYITLKNESSMKTIPGNLVVFRVIDDDKYHTTTKDVDQYVQVIINKPIIFNANDGKIHLRFGKKGLYAGLYVGVLVAPNGNIIATNKKHVDNNAISFANLDMTIRDSGPAFQTMKLSKVKLAKSGWKTYVGTTSSNPNGKDIHWDL